jgi:DNA-binding transcriptional LysR family regulator
MRSISYQSLRRLAYFEAIAHAGSIRGAAQRIGLSVPVLSAALAELEEELNVTLAVRSTRSLELTDAGQRVYQDASRLMDAAFSALDHTDENQQLTGTVGVTMVAELALHWLPQHLSKFRSLYPDVTLNVDANDHVVDLENSPYDLAIRTEYCPTKPAIDMHNGTVFGSLDLVMVAREHPVVRPVKNDIELAVETTYLVGPGNTEWITAYRPGSNSLTTLHPSKHMSVANREAAIAFAKQGLGCALVMKLSVQDDLDAGRLVEVCPDMSFGVVTLRTVMRDSLPSMEARRLKEILSSKSDAIAM